MMMCLYCCEFKYITKYIAINGILTSLYFLLFYVCNEFCQMFYLVANFFSYTVATTLAFLCTKIYVFKSKEYNFSEIVSFIIVRLLVILTSSFLLCLGNSYLGIGKYYSFFIVNVFCFAMSYYLNRRIFIKCDNLGGNNGKK